MDEPTPSFTKRHKLLLATLGVTALSFGGVGMAWATDSPPSSTPPTTAEKTEQGEANEAGEAGEANEAGVEVDGVDCVDGIDAATGAECDGGPAANPTDDSAEAGAETAD